LRKSAAANDDMLRDVSARLDGLTATIETQADLLTSATAEPRDAKALADLRRLTAANEKTLREVSDRLDELVAEGVERTELPPVRQLEGFESMVADLREEMTQLRRRIGLRTKGPSPIGEDQLDRIADAVAARIDVPSSGFDDRQLDQLVDTIVDRLQRVIEVVEEEVPPKPAPKPAAKSAAKSAAKPAPRRQRAPRSN
jgi:hypothetical protein